MKSNFLSKGIILILIIILVLITLSFFPNLEIGSWKLSKFDIFSDIRKKKTTVETVKKKKEKVKIIVPKGVYLIENYSKDSIPLKIFFDALNNQDYKKQPVRVAFFGDSFIEGDIMCSDFRDTLQSVFGGRGVGYVPITSEVARFRTTIQHTFKNFSTFTIIKNNSKTQLGGGGFCFIPQEKNSLTYQSVKQRYLNSFHKIRLFYISSDKSSFTYKLSGQTYNSGLSKSSSIQQYIIDANSSNSISFNFDNTDNLKLYGVSFEDTAGIYIDNMSMRGNSGVGLAKIPESMHSQFDKLQQYKLIILQFGLNVINEKTTNLTWYKKSMIKVINMIKSSYPNSSILLLGISDRSCKIDGEYTSLPSIPIMIETQRYIAKTTQIAYWDLFTAMGGKNSMIRYADSCKPAMANKDYTHLTYPGGKYIAHVFAKSLLFESNRYYGKKN